VLLTVRWWAICRAHVYAILVIYADVSDDHKSNGFLKLSRVLRFKTGTLDEELCSLATYTCLSADNAAIQKRKATVTPPVNSTIAPFVSNSLGCFLIHQPAKL
jgi:hypothetical protein